MLKESGSIVFCDATSNKDRQDSKFFQMLTVGPSGGLPLGFVLISREAVEMLTAEFELFKAILPPKTCMETQMFGWPSSLDDRRRGGLKTGEMISGFVPSQL